jgi:uncharacterized protein
VPLPDSRYVSLTTFRRSGVPVATPVWAAPFRPRAGAGPVRGRGEQDEAGSLVVWTRADSGKVKRLRHTTRVTVAPCDVRGRPSGPAVPAVAGFLPEPEWPQALTALRRRYGLRFQLGLVASRAWGRLRHPDQRRHELLLISPAG